MTSILSFLRTYWRFKRAGLEDVGWIYVSKYDPALSAARCPCESYRSLSRGQ